MSDPQHHDSVSFTTSLFGIKMSGGNAIIIFLFIVNLALIGLILFESQHRITEHQNIVCSTRLAIYVYTTPKGEAIDWNRMPTDLYPCVPKFLFDRPVR